jgi:triacylglycerol esterase/lipase EstA (alpha/beta hydrolase family)
MPEYITNPTAIENRQEFRTMSDYWAAALGFSDMQKSFPLTFSTTRRDDMNPATPINEPSNNDPPATPTVVLIHGLSANRLLMMPLAWRLQRAGFKTRTFGYFSSIGSIEWHAKRLGKFLARLDRDSVVAEIHIVSHSLGGIVTRQALLDSTPGKVRRLVMLAPPNQGSPAASLLSTYIVPFCKTLRQIASREGSFVRELPEPIGIEIGVVTASYDFVVPKESASLNCQTDNVTVFSGHNGLLVRKTAAKQTIEFLSTGKFSHAS